MKRARTAEAKEERRAIILKAALDVFYEKGFSAAGTDDIAERAGISKGTLYLYFSSKDELFEALIESLTKPNLAALELISKSAPSIEVAFQGFASFAPQVIQQSDMPRLMKVLIGESQVFPEVISNYKKNIIDSVLSIVAGILSAAKERGEISIGDPTLIARLVVAPIVFSGVWEAVFAAHDDNPIDLETLFKTHAQFMLKAIKSGDSL